MGRISNEGLYPKDNVISDKDRILGTDGDSVAGKTKNFSPQDLAKYVASFIESGGTSFSDIPQFSSAEQAYENLGGDQRFRWSENNLDGVPSPNGSQVGITKQTL